jgi:poly(hydroxyalkanoate) depolymerase family esterase
MNPKFTAAMRRAAASTHALDVMEATRIIQEALGTKAATPASTNEPDITPPQRQAQPRLRLIDPDAEIIEPEAPPAAQQSKRMRKPLGEVLEALRKARSTGGSGIEGINMQGMNLQGMNLQGMNLQGMNLQGMNLPGMKGKTVPPVIPEGAQFLTRSFANAAGSRGYKLYIPAPTGEQPRGLIVMLHGCKQNPDDFATGTRMNALAEAHNLLVAYPEQTGAANASSCGNWFNPGDQARDKGEPSIIAGLTREIIAEFALDDTRIFVAGLSAGGAMAAVMGETYPELYSAMGVHSGLACGSANDVMSAFAAMRGDPAVARGPARHPHIRTIVFHGTADRTVHPSNAERILASAGQQHERATAGGRSYSRTLVASNSGGAHEFWRIEGAGHAWSGGDANGSYADAQGPDASAEMVRFFLEKQ